MVDEKWSARFRSYEEIRSRGAIGNLTDGIEITTQGVRTRLIAWPGNGFRIRYRCESDCNDLC